VKLLIDMNLPPLWAEVLQRHGWEAVHWSAVGDARASDRTIMEWARANSYVVFTHDLDFAALLAATGSDGPSVIQVRTQDVTPEHIEGIVTRALRQNETLLEGSVLITIDEARARCRILPLRR
jgi:predicted nuclease of predicted toxin-antitoxin system